MRALLEWMVRHAAWLRRLALLVLAGLVLADLLIPTAYQRFPWDRIGGFGAFYGFISCVLIIVASKAVGYLLLYRSEDYYDD